MSIGDGRVISSFIVHALRGEPLAVYGDGDQTRSFCYVDDTIGGLVKLMNTPREITGPINIGNTTEITIRDLAGMIIRLTGSKSQITPQEVAKRRSDAPATRHYEGRRHARLGTFHAVANGNREDDWFFRSSAEYEEYPSFLRLGTLEKAYRGERDFRQAPFVECPSVARTPRRRPPRRAGDAVIVRLIIERIEVCGGAVVVVDEETEADFAFPKGMWWRRPR